MICFVHKRLRQSGLQSPFQLPLFVAEPKYEYMKRIAKAQKKDSSYLLGRKRNYERIRKCVSDSILKEDSSVLQCHGESKRLLEQIPDRSINLIVTDPPYHSTKKENITGDTSFKSDDAYLKWINSFLIEWRRVISVNGTLYLFCASDMMSDICSLLRNHWNILSVITWTKPNAPGFDGWKQKMKKENLRSWYNYSERIIVAEPAFAGNLHKSFFGQWLRKVRESQKMSGHRLTELTDAYGKVNHGGAVSNWEAGRNIPSREQFAKLLKALRKGINKHDCYYEDFIRPFNITAKDQFTDVWDFETIKPYKGKHPAEKPFDLLKHIINTSSYEGDIVLDCFSGSGNTGYVAKSLKRRCILNDIEKHWCEFSSLKLFNAKKALRQPLSDNDLNNSDEDFTLS